MTAALQKYTFDLMVNLYHHNQETFRHSLRVGDLMYQFGQFQKMPSSVCRTFYSMGVLHDIGKLAIPNSILAKKGRLTEDEFNEIKKHPIYGKELLQKQGNAEHLLEPILFHHENVDGSGYYQKKQADISYESMLIRLVDSYDTLVNGRSYQRYLPNTWAVEELMRFKGTYYEPELTDVFKKFLDFRYS